MGKCIICGKSTKFNFKYCKDCYDKLENKEEVIEEPKKIEKSNTIVINNENKSRCIACGKETDGLLFCTTCYHQYKNKELLIRIKNCSSVEILDESYENIIDCKDKHIVKSKSERFIDDYLFENQIPHAYEKGLIYGADEKDIIYPDFYLPDYLGKGKHVYIEHWGYNENNKDYTKSKKFKLSVYKKLKITLVCINEKDITKIDTVLERKLNKKFIKENEINFDEE